MTANKLSLSCFVCVRGCVVLNYLLCDLFHQMSVTPYPERQFPLEDNQYCDMLHENALVVDYAVPQGPASDSGMDYDEVAESNFDDEELVDRDNGEDYTPDSDGNRSKRKLVEATAVSDPKRRNMRHSSTVGLKQSILANHDCRPKFNMVSKTNHEVQLSDRFRRRSLLDNTEKIRKSSPVSNNMKDHLNRSTVSMALLKVYHYKWMFSFHHKILRCSSVSFQTFRCHCRGTER